MVSLTASDTAWPAVVSEQDVPAPPAVAQLKLVADPFLTRVALVWIAGCAEKFLIWSASTVHAPKTVKLVLVALDISVGHPDAELPVQAEKSHAAPGGTYIVCEVVFGGATAVSHN